MYTAGVLPFVFAATIFGATRFRDRKVDFSLWVLVGAACLCLYSPIYYGSGDIGALGSPKVAAKSHALSLIPGGVPVSATNELGGHLSERRRIYTFPKVLRASWIIVDRNDSTYLDERGFKRRIRDYVADKRWRIVYSSHGITVLRRTTS
jgi:hypothetical protein